MQLTGRIQAEEMVVTIIGRRGANDDNVEIVSDDSLHCVVSAAPKLRLGRCLRFQVRIKPLDQKIDPTDCGYWRAKLLLPLLLDGGREDSSGFEKKRFIRQLFLFHSQELYIYFFDS